MELLESFSIQPRDYTYDLFIQNMEQYDTMYYSFAKEYLATPVKELTVTVESSLVLTDYEELEEPSKTQYDFFANIQKAMILSLTHSWIFTMCKDIAYSDIYITNESNDYYSNSTSPTLHFKVTGVKTEETFVKEKLFELYKKAHDKYQTEFLKRKKEADELKEFNRLKLKYAKLSKGIKESEWDR